MLRSTLLIPIICFVYAAARTESFFAPGTDHAYYHKNINKGTPTNLKFGPSEEEKTAEYWIRQGRQTVADQLNKRTVHGIAKNVIMFLGDGMSIPTLAATRVYLGQQNNKPGEETKLSFEKFPFVGLSKTYCVNYQVADSACSATAYLSGVKANLGTIGVTAAVEFEDCKGMTNVSNHVDSIAYKAQLNGKRTGVVTTTRITHASPSGVYGHTAERDWESDTNILEAGHDPTVCRDLAHQLVHGKTGSNLNVILGGGRWAFLPKTEVDEDGLPGYRSDGRNLINEWKDGKSSSSHQYVSNRDGLLEIPSSTEYVLGLFANDHVPYNLDRDEQKTPSLEEMTVKAIDLLSQGENGYFLFVEGGRIDHAHHETRPRKSLEETVEFQKAVQAALGMTNIEDTLIVVTSDHAHTLSVSGYPFRGNDILGIGGTGDDGLPYLTLGYANGPGYRPEENGKRHDVSNDDLSDKDYQYPVPVPLEDETHGGDDVGIFARGPYAHLLVGVLEQNVIPHVMKFASCLSEEPNACSLPSASAALVPPFVPLLIFLYLAIMKVLQ